ncbi:MAG: S8 family serine peptidase [Actinomycetota bacterium]|nr:S8 family serine peptidase [Actinomycetota bacterium]
MRVSSLVALHALVVVAAFAAPAQAGGDPLQPAQWALPAVAAPDAWQSATGRGAIIAVVDTGVDRDHPEFQGRLLPGASWVCPRAVQAPCGDWDDRNGHGTHVAGIAAAPLDGRGIVGVAKDAKILPVRVLDEKGVGIPRHVAAGIRWAVDQGADVINLSLGGLPLLSQVGGLVGLDGGFFDAINYALDHDVLVVAAAGNDALPLCSNQELLSAGVLCVGAVDRDGVRSGYSNFGIGVQVVAPGGAGGTPCGDPREDVLSTVAPDGVLLGRCQARHPLGESPTTVPTEALTGYTALAGTSMAAPHAAGVGALLAEDGVRGRDAANRIRATADDLGLPGADLVYGWGQVNAAKAVAGAP